ncbi:MAG TPA: hypothetical protein PKD58_04400 [Candidatus Sumerlaeota bacterium]|nr:hypothetical protein [Candidatus Sumerlaeota bacterium]
MIGAAPLAGRAVAEDIAKQAGIEASGLKVNSVLSGSMVGNVQSGVGRPPSDMWREAFRVYPELRSQQESTFFEQEKIGTIDPDIAVYRSFSMAAKIAFQKQRNVARRMDELQGVPWWHKTETLFQKITALLK